MAKVSNGLVFVRLPHSPPANQNLPIVHSSSRPAFNNYIEAFYRLQFRLQEFLDVLQMHREICEEITRLGAGDFRIRSYTEDCEHWCECIDRIQGNDPSQPRTLTDYLAARSASHGRAAYQPPQPDDAEPLFPVIAGDAL